MDTTTIVSFVLLILEAYLFTGIIFGFPNLRVILENEGIWSCVGIENVTTVGCPDQSKYSQVLVFVLLFELKISNKFKNREQFRYYQY